ncbi:hypothetical protein [Stenotrophomonas maltophilia]|uniref:hypothetical protein n=1 Tax=Stenotrophomonas maltophilia TaxID=40324 RepID=UPI0012F79C96|nr:hypothetical protein [Stenotrophomonas maltophilia]
MSSLQQLWHGISPCMEPGVGDCVVWWDAWGVAVAFAALAVGCVNVVVAVLAAIAVYWLGKQANALATASSDAQRREDGRRQKQSEDEQNRERSVALAYCCAELSELNIHLGFLASYMQPGGKAAKDVFVSDQAMRTRLFKLTTKLQTSRLESMLPRLHALPEETGVDLGLLLGSCGQLCTQLKIAAETGSPETFSDPEQQKRRRRYLSHVHDTNRQIAESARSLARRYAELGTTLINRPKKTG